MFYRDPLFSFSFRFIANLIACFAVCFVLVTQLQGQETPGYFRANREKRANRQPAVQDYKKNFQEAVRNIPWNSLPPKAKEKIKSVVLNPSLYRRMPRQTVVADPEMYQFLTEHPDLVVGFWDVLGATQMSLREIHPNQYRLAEEAGTIAAAEILYRTSEICIVYAKGQYSAPLLARPCEGDAVLVLKTRCSRTEDNRPLVVSDLDSFVCIDNIGVDFIAKLFAASLGKIADENFEQTVAFVAYLSQIASSNAGEVKRMVSQIQGVPLERKEEFYDVIDRVALRAAHRSRVLIPIHQYEIVSAPADVFSLTEEEKTVFFESEELPEPKHVAAAPSIVDEDISVFLDRLANDASYEVPLGKIAENITALPSELPQKPLPIPESRSVLKERETETTVTAKKEIAPPVKKSKAVFGTPKIAK